MKVLLADTGGFCMGVKRAMDMILQSTEEERGRDNICTFGPLIHNRQVLEMLGKKGVQIIETPEECVGKTVLIRAHGIPPDQRKAIKAKAKRVLDATCPRVARVQALIRRYARRGYLPIIVGDPDHAEVKGLLGYSDGRGIVVNKVEDMNNMPDAKRILVVAQTTQNEETFQEIASFIKSRYQEVEVFDTICGSTHERQEEVRRMSHIVDAMVVVGGYHSGNTLRLAEISRQCGLPTFHVETEKELNPEKLADFNTVGVTAGASTPSWMIRRVVKVLESLSHRKRSFYRHYLFRSLKVILNTNLVVAVGASILSYIAAGLSGVRRPFYLAFMASLYIFAMHTLNRYTDKVSLRLREPEQVDFYEKYFVALYMSGVVAIIGALYLAFKSGLLPFLIILLITLLGLLYNVPIFRHKKGTLKHVRRFKDIPGSKTLFVAGAWGAVTSIIPDMAVGLVHITRTIYAFIIISLMVFVRTAIFDLLDIQGDSIVGKETIPVFIGETKTKYLLAAIIFLTAILLLASPLLNVPISCSWILLPSTALLGGCLLIYRNRVLLSGTLFEILVESFSYLGGFLFLCVKLLSSK